MKVAITGAAGHLGANLTRTLLGRGWEVRALVRRNTEALEGLDVDRVRGDLDDAAALAALCRGVDRVFHLAGHVSIEPADREHTWHVNVDGTRAVARACLEAGVGRLVHFSSIHAFDDTPGVPIDERRGPASRPGSPHYGLSKAAGERAVLEAVAEGLDAVIVNPTGVIGPHDYGPSPMGRVLSTMMRGGMPVLPLAGFDWVDARDVADGAIEAALRGRTGERYLLAGTFATLMDLARAVDRIVGRRRLRVQVPLWTAWLGVPFAGLRSRLTGTPRSVTPDSVRTLYGEGHVCCAKAAAELGFRGRPIEESLVDIVAWHGAREGCAEAPMPVTP